jgi:Ca-activated chloride channel family protein
MMMPLSDTAQAFEWDSLWLRADQRAKRELDAGNLQTAAEIFKDKAWKGAAQYKAGDFQASLESLETRNDIETLYNKGNALARLGQYEQAIKNYDSVLEQMPEHEDAQHNKALLEEELEKQQQQQEQQQQSQQDQDQNKDEKDGEQQQQEGEDSQDQEGEQSEQKKIQDQKEQQGNEQNESNKDEKEEELTPEEKQKLAEEKKKEEQKKAEQKESEQEEKEQQGQLAKVNPDEMDEEQQATEQWLRRIPDDPAGLLRRKFRYQYQQRQNQQSTEEKTW